MKHNKKWKKLLSLSIHFKKKKMFHSLDQLKPKTKDKTKILFASVNENSTSFLYNLNRYMSIFRRAKKFSCPLFSKCISKLKCQNKKNRFLVFSFSFSFWFQFIQRIEQKFLIQKQCINFHDLNKNNLGFFELQAGISRSTTGMIIASLIKEFQLASELNHMKGKFSLKILLYIIKVS